MSTDRPDSSEDLDDIPTLRPVRPGDDGDDRERDDYRDDLPPPPPRKPGFGFWLAVVWALLYFVVTQIIAGIGFTSIALVPEVQRNGWDVVTDPVKFKEVISPVLKKIIALDPERRGQGTGLTSRASLSSARGDRSAPGERKVIEF